VPNSFVFDPNRCTGCHACRLVCSIENQLDPQKAWRRIETFNPRHHPAIPLYHLSLACNHCAVPACMYACPALAYSRDRITGAVLLDDIKCIGCRYCSWACPYNAPVFDPDRGIMSKCTFCNHRLRDGLKPACASLCPTGALDHADLPEEQLTNHIGGFPNTDLSPRIAIRPIQPGRSLPVMSSSEVELPFVGTVQPEISDISLKSEWSLMLFTSLAAVLVAAVASTLERSFRINPIAFAGGAALAMGLATLHLGRISRAYRAVLNLRRSWLSREVTALSMFFALGTIYVWLMPESRAAGVAVTLVGFFALLCTDRVYSVLAKSGSPHRHSASVLWTGFFLTAVFGGITWLAAIFGLGKLSLYVLRKLAFLDKRKSVRPITTALRTGVGLVLPSFLWLMDFERFYVYIITAVLIGELIDRGEYYEELESQMPGREMFDELQKQIAGHGRQPAVITS
jgi:Fe-S-cluster-containing dehydrogenase component/DMSO reductase anchor subunit